MTPPPLVGVGGTTGVEGGGDGVAIGEVTGVVAAVGTGVGVGTPTPLVGVGEPAGVGVGPAMVCVAPGEGVKAGENVGVRVGVAVGIRGSVGEDLSEQAARSRRPQTTTQSGVEAQCIENRIFMRRVSLRKRTEGANGDSPAAPRRFGAAV